MAASTTPDPKLGLLLLGRYRIVRKLGEGGMGAVYEGLHELIGKRLAIKCLHAQFASNAEIVERFYREAQSATAVGNEHIIEVTDVGNFDDGSPFLVMEYLDGIELAKLIEQESALPIARLVHIATQVCSALAAAHARGIVHRDMKPENIYLIRRGSDPDFVKVLDFGISKMRENSEALGTGLTRTGMALGTPYYMAPEQAQGVRDIDQRADIYSVGVILYQALSGNLPFDAESYPALLLKMMTERPAPLRVFRNDIPEALEQVVLKTMARDRHERFQHIEEVSDALARFAVIQTLPGSQVAGRSSATSAMPQTTPFVTVHDAPGTTTGAGAVTNAGTGARPKSRGALIGAAVAVLAIGAIAAVMVSGGEKDKHDKREREHVVTPAEQQPPVQPVQAAQPTAPIAAPEPQLQLQPAPAPAAPQEVQVKIFATPSEAKIFIDDQEFPNPMDAFRPRSLDPIRIRVEARGHETVEQLVIFDQNRSFSFALAKGRGVRRLDANGAASASKPDKPETAATPEIVKTPEPAPAPEPANDGIYHGPSGKLRQDF